MVTAEGSQGGGKPYQLLALCVPDLMSSVGGHHPISQQRKPRLRSGNLPKVSQRVGGQAGVGALSPHCHPHPYPQPLLLNTCKPPDVSGPDGPAPGSPRSRAVGWGEGSSLY